MCDEVGLTGPIEPETQTEENVNIFNLEDFQDLGGIPPTMDEMQAAKKPQDVKSVNDFGDLGDFDTSILSIELSTGSSLSSFSEPVGFGSVDLYDIYCTYFFHIFPA